MYNHSYCINGVNSNIFKDALLQSIKTDSKRPRVFIQSSVDWHDTINKPKWKPFSSDVILKDCDIIELENHSSDISKPLLSSYNVNPIRVSAIVSTYKSERFMRGCLEDLVNQTLYKKGGLEIVVVDACSPEKEGDIVKEYRDKYANIKYIRTDDRISLYSAWNLGIQNASGEYVTSANTDDRHAPDMLERMAWELGSHPEFGLAYADCFITRTENVTFIDPRPTGIYTWKEHSHKELLKGCYIGPQPVWRRSLHDRFGYFDEEYRSAGDYEFWLRLSAGGVKFQHIPLPLGVYFENPFSISLGNKQLSWEEKLKAQYKYLNATPYASIAMNSISDNLMDASVEKTKRDIKERPLDDQPDANEDDTPDADDFDSRMRSAEIYANWGRWIEVIRLTRLCIEEQPDDWAAKNLLSVALWNTGEHEEAQKIMREGMVSAPNKREFSANMASALLEEGDTLNALEYVLQAVNS